MKPGSECRPAGVEARAFFLVRIAETVSEKNAAVIQGCLSLPRNSLILVEL